MIERSSPGRWISHKFSKMYRLASYVSIYLFFFAIQSSFAQGGENKIFKKGDQVCEAGGGIALFFQTSITWKGQDTTYYESSGSFIFPVRYQYAVTDWFGFGGMFRFHNFFEGVNDESQAIAADLGARADFHFLRTRRIDGSAALGIGFSHMSWKGNDLSNQHFYGSGLHYDLELISRFFFSDHFGMHLCYGRTYLNLPNMILEDDYGNRDELKFLLSGWEFSIGLQVKF